MERRPPAEEAESDLTTPLVMTPFARGPGNASRKCTYCHQPLGIAHRLRGDNFCSPEHERAYFARESAAAFQRLRVETPNVPKPEPVVLPMPPAPETPEQETAPRISGSGTPEPSTLTPDGLPLAGFVSQAPLPPDPARRSAAGSFHEIVTGPSWIAPRLDVARKEAPSAALPELKPAPPDRDSGMALAEVEEQRSVPPFAMPRFTRDREPVLSVGEQIPVPPAALHQQEPQARRTIQDPLRPEEQEPTVAWSMKILDGRAFGGPLPGAEAGRSKQIPLPAPAEWKSDVPLSTGLRSWSTDRLESETPPARTARKLWTLPVNHAVPNRPAVEELPASGLPAPMLLPALFDQNWLPQADLPPAARKTLRTGEEKVHGSGRDLSILSDLSCQALIPVPIPVQLPNHLPMVTVSSGLRAPWAARAPSVLLPQLGGQPKIEAACFALATRTPDAGLHPSMILVESGWIGSERAPLAQALIPVPIPVQLPNDLRMVTVSSGLRAPWEAQTPSVLLPQLGGQPKIEGACSALATRTPDAGLHPSMILVESGWIGSERAPLAQALIPVPIPVQLPNDLRMVTVSSGLRAPWEAQTPSVLLPQLGGQPKIEGACSALGTRTPDASLHPSMILAESGWIGSVRAPLAAESLSALHLVSGSRIAPGDPQIPGLSWTVSPLPGTAQTCARSPWSSPVAGPSLPGPATLDPVPAHALARPDVVLQQHARLRSNGWVLALSGKCSSPKLRCADAHPYTATVLWLSMEVETQPEPPAAGLLLSSWRTPLCVGVVSPLPDTCVPPPLRHTLIEGWLVSRRLAVTDVTHLPFAAKRGGEHEITPAIWHVTGPGIRQPALRKRHGHILQTTGWHDAGILLLRTGGAPSVEFASPAPVVITPAIPEEPRGMVSLDLIGCSAMPGQEWIRLREPYVETRFARDWLAPEVTSACPALLALRTPVTAPAPIRGIETAISRGKAVHMEAGCWAAPAGDPVQSTLPHPKAAFQIRSVVLLTSLLPGPDFAHADTFGNFPIRRSPAYLTVFPEPRFTALPPRLDGVHRLRRLRPQDDTAALGISASASALSVDSPFREPGSGLRLSASRICSFSGETVARFGNAVDSTPQALVQPRPLQARPARFFQWPYVAGEPRTPFICGLGNLARFVGTASDIPPAPLRHSVLRAKWS